MKKKFSEIIDYLEFDELIKIKKDLCMGGIHLHKVLDSQIRREIQKHEHFCCICNSRIMPDNVNNFTLIFGPQDLQRKISFCAIDCLEYFISNLKELRKENIGERKEIEDRMDEEA